MSASVDAAVEARFRRAALIALRTIRATLDHSVTSRENIAVAALTPKVYDELVKAEDTDGKAVSAMAKTAARAADI